jgi:putative transposase
MHGHCRPAQRGLVSAALREVFGHRSRRRSASYSRAPRMTAGVHCVPAEHWTKLRSTNPLERVNREIGRRSDVVGTFPNDTSTIRLAGALLVEQNDEWIVCRRYL